MTQLPFITRFAPSPTGYLHLGHAYSALTAYALAHAMNGKFILRIEDIDPTRCKEIYVQAILEDLAWLGLRWEEPVLIQSAHMRDYQDNLDVLRKRGLLYPCFCTRASIAKEQADSAGAPHTPAGERVYAGTCRRLSDKEREAKMTLNAPHCWRLDMEKACAEIEKSGRDLVWLDTKKGLIKARPQAFGDSVLARKDMPTSYHLSVVTDDARQGVSRIVRGEDLIPATDIHCLLQQLLGLPTPTYTHHPLLTDDDGNRYAKRNQSVTLRALRDQGYTPEDIFRKVGVELE